MTRSIAFALVISALGLAGCDNTPNTQFERQMKGDKSTDSGDRYAALDYVMPLQSDYVRWNPQTRSSTANRQAGYYAARYEGLLKILAGDTAIDPKGALYATCRPAFADALEFQRATPPATDMAPKVVAALRRCHVRTQAAESAGGAEAAGAALLGRFASAGLVLVGVVSVARGDERAGLAVWREGEVASRRYRSGFKIDASSFQIGN